MLLRHPEDELVRRRGQLAQQAERLQHLPGAAGLPLFGTWLQITSPEQLRRHHDEMVGRGRGAPPSVSMAALPGLLPLLLDAVIEPRTDASRLAGHRRTLELLRADLEEAATPYVAVVDALCGALPGGRAR